MLITVLSLLLAVRQCHVYITESRPPAAKRQVRMWHRSATACEGDRSNLDAGLYLVHMAVHTLVT